MNDSGDRREAVVEALKASQLREVLHEYADALKARRRGIDDLNVYPVPDGDTGTNMSLTVQSVVKELKSAAADDMVAITQAISRGATMGARGNSGAILAQALRGVAESAREKTSLTPNDIAEALEKARKSAYEAVLKPVEGTILTVLTAAAESARKSADEGHKLKEQLDNVRQAAAEALARTPDLLPVLKQAGVVDAGGSGFLLFVDALRYVATGEPIPGLTDAESGREDTDGPKHHVDGGDIAELRYEVMFLLEGDADAPAFRESWGRVGDSIVVVGGDGLWNCHIHTDDIGASLEVALDYGRPRQIRVTDLHEQVGEHERTSREEVETAVVAVVSGHGLVNTYRSLGVDVVEGGQSANPSVEELLRAIELAPSQCVIVLPNNKNVKLAAHKAAEASTKDVRVVETVSPVQGLGALFDYDATQPLASVHANVSSAADRIVSGEITRAVRNALTEAGQVTKGDWMGVGPEGISVIEKSVDAALVALAGKLVGADAELVTVVEGEGATPEATAALRDWVETNRPGAELQVQSGGQPLYPYLLGVE